MKITGFEVFPVLPRWQFLKIETDEGLCGWGEPVVEGRAHTVKAAVEELSYYFMGQRGSVANLLPRRLLPRRAGGYERHRGY